MNLLDFGQYDVFSGDARKQVRDVVEGIGGKCEHSPMFWRSEVKQVECDDFKVTYDGYTIRIEVDGNRRIVVNGIEVGLDGEMKSQVAWRDDSHWTDGGYEYDGAYFCTACKCDLPDCLQEAWDSYQSGHYDERPFDYCPCCGAEVMS